MFSHTQATKIAGKIADIAREAAAEQAAQATDDLGDSRAGMALFSLEQDLCNLLCTEPEAGR